MPSTKVLLCVLVLLLVALVVLGVVEVITRLRVGHKQDKRIESLEAQVSSLIAHLNGDPQALNNLVRSRGLRSAWPMPGPAKPVPDNARPMATPPMAPPPQSAPPAPQPVPPAQGRAPLALTAGYPEPPIDPKNPEEVLWWLNENKADGIELDTPVPGMLGMKEVDRLRALFLRTYNVELGATPADAEVTQVIEAIRDSRDPQVTPTAPPADDPADAAIPTDTPPSA